jgi:hypothetical protein
LAHRAWEPTPKPARTACGVSEPRQSRRGRDENDLVAPATGTALILLVAFVLPGFITVLLQERTVFIVGRIPYERITVMDWDGGRDPAYNLVRFYVRYGWRGPLRDVVLYDMPDEYGHESELRGVKYKPDRVPPGMQMRWALESRRERKRLGLKHPYDD